MVDRRSKKISVLIFLFGIFAILVAVTAGWLYKVYTEQTAYSEQSTLATVECSRYYFKIDPDSVMYENGTLYFEARNTLGADVDVLVLESATDMKEVAVSLSQGLTIPVSVDIDIVEWVTVYPVGCKGVNFQNLSFEPREEQAADTGVSQEGAAAEVA